MDDTFIDDIDFLDIATHNGLDRSQREQLEQVREQVSLTSDIDYPYSTSAEDAWEYYQDMLRLFDWFNTLGENFL